MLWALFSGVHRFFASSQGAQKNTDVPANLSQSTFHFFFIRTKHPMFRVNPAKSAVAKKGVPIVGVRTSRVRNKIRWVLQVPNPLYPEQQGTKGKTQIHD